ncbi:nucleoside-diphosphate kinase [Candidatus Gracilibacteria bacterium]|nr:nucleoside-diphosphate kinase [Candidatus Gracilibacteria bacterium]
MEKTLIILKPEIPESEKNNITVSKEKFKKIFLRIIKANGYKIENIKETIIDKETAQLHYAEKKEHPLFNDVVEYISSDISTILSISGENSIKNIRCIALKMREKYIGKSKLYNLIHSSDSKHESDREHQIHF